MKKRIRSWTLYRHDVALAVGAFFGWGFGTHDWLEAGAYMGILLGFSLCYNRVIGDYP